ncbi:hypothetical protein ASG52_02485 [Methylobacterium sp. Leaf456]|nr:hypothetical protein ASG52_02485 [Methylobacterium sp. Leaf456]
MQDSPITELVLDPARLAALGGYSVLDTAPEEGFDDIARLATRLCDVPVALVSLVAVDRQWFKASIGFPRCETDLDRSVCKFALAEPDLLVVPDLTKDPRTAANPLVIDEPCIRFYAGAPLRMPDGVVLGSLCVIDTVARPDGLTPEQAEDLRALGRQVSNLLELRRTSASERRAQEAAVANATRLEGMMAAQQASEALARDNIQRVQLALAAGAIIGTWHWDIPNDRFTVDEAFAQAFGLDPALGREGIPLAGIVATVHPADQAGLSDAIREAVTRGGAYAHQYRVRRADGRYYWIEANGRVERGSDGKPRSFPGVLLDIEERYAAQEALRASESHWRSLFENLSEGFLVGEVVRDTSGAITDWRYVDVNAAWGELVGIDPAGVVGRTLREVIPDVEDVWIDEFATVVETRQSTSFTRRVDALERWYEGRAFPLGLERFGVIFLEITHRVQAEARRNALLSLGDRLRDVDTSSAMTAAAAEIVGRTLGATRAAFGQIEGEVEFVTVEPDWFVPGHVSIAGRHRFDDYGDIRAQLARGEALVIDDVTTDPRTRDDPEPMLAIGIRALINVPVRERGRTVSIFVVHDDKPRVWTSEELAFLRNVTDRVEVGVGRVRAEEQQALLNGELSHRLKNTLAMVQGIAGQTLRLVPDQAPVKAFTERLIALSRAHDVLLQDSWAAAPIRSVIEKVLALQVSLDRFVIEGPNLALAPQATLSLSLLLHELTTNAVKYGALSTEAGVVRLGWRIEAEPEQTVVLSWLERGGPPATAPTRRGFGARLIQSGLVGTRDTRLDYSVTGLDAEFRAPISQVVTS